VDSDEEAAVGRDRLEKGERENCKSVSTKSTVELHASSEDEVVIKTPVTKPKELKVSMHRLMSNITGYSAKNANMGRKTRSSLSKVHDLES